VQRRSIKSFTHLHPHDVVIAWHHQSRRSHPIVGGARIGRIIDRARTYEERLVRASGDDATQLTSRLQVLSRRAALISWAIGLSVVCALLVSLVVTGLFLSAALAIDLTLPIAIGFVIALLSLALALVLFLREVVIANAAMTFGGTKPAKEAKGKKPTS
jgi:hypothetical protein